MPEIYYHVGQAIKGIRSRHKLSQERFGKRVGISGKTISAYENNKTFPSLRVLEKISEEYCFEIYEFKPPQIRKIENQIKNIKYELDNLKEMLDKVSVIS